MATVQDIVTGALRLIEVVAGSDSLTGSDTPSNEDLTVGLFALNELINSWNAQHWPVYSITNQQHTLSAGTGSYTIGNGGVINVPRPSKIESAGIVQTNGARTELALTAAKVWAAIPNKSATGKQPLNLYNDGDYPLSKLFLWPIPRVACTLDLWVWEQITEPLALGDALDLPPDYERAIRFNLAVTLAPEFGREPSPTVAAIAQQSRQELFGLNASNAAATEDPPQQLAA